MAEAITVAYAEHEDNWTVTVSGLGEQRTEHAPGIIAARAAADQLVDSISSTREEVAVVHLLRGSALEFTTAYMTARLGRTTDAEPEIPTQPTADEATDSDQDASGEESEEAAEEAAEEQQPHEEAESAVTS